MSRIQIDLHSVSLVTSQAAEKHMQTNQALQDTQRLVDGRLAGLEQILLEQFAQLKANLATELGPALGGSLSLVNRPPPSPGRNALSQQSKGNSADATTGVSIKTTQYNRFSCEPNCRCNCHTSRELRSASLIGPVMGQLFVGYVGQPRIRQTCTHARCRRTTTTTVSIEYFFPIWFLARIVMLVLSYQKGAGPQMQLRTIRYVPDSSQSITYALNGNIDGLKSLFTQGLASPNDVSQGRKYSLLRVCNSKWFYEENC
jgi:hypothetical protein